MKLIGLQLRNWRGIDERKVMFAETGVTVVEGPNEVGKSSLIEAFDLLLEYLDDTKNRDVLAVRPVHKDAGAEVEAEIQSGKYRFTYGKRFHKRSETKLVVTQPIPENLTGREAHERVRAILDETVDMELWSALRIEQGQEVTQANLSQQKSLSSALDNSAGVVQTDDTVESLFEAIRRERERYFTPNGNPRKEMAELEAAVSSLEGELANSSSELAKLETDIELSARLDRELKESVRAAQESGELVARHDTRLKEIGQLEERVRNLKTTLDTASNRLTEADRLDRERRELVEESRTATTEYSTMNAAEDLTTPAFAEAQQERDAADKALSEASHALEAAENVAAVAKRDLEYRKDALDLQLLVERQSRIENADRSAKEAAATLARSKVTDESLRKLQKAHNELEAARGALAAGSPELRIRALAKIAPIVDGKPHPLTPGKEVTVPVSGSLSIAIPGVAEIDVSTGSTNASLRSTHDSKRDTFNSLCRAANVENLEQAILAHGEWQSAKRTVEQRDSVVAVDLRDLTREKMADKIAVLQSGVERYPLTRVAGLPIPKDSDAAKEESEAADDRTSKARQARAFAELRRNGAQKRIEALKDLRAQTAVALETARTKASVASTRLEQARAKALDEALLNAMELAKSSQRVAIEAHEGERSRLVAEQPDEIRVLAENARATKKSADERVRKIENEQIAVRERLKERGEAGFAERASIASTKLSRAADTLARRRSHAAAAKMLFDTFEQERNSARKAYVAPLQREIGSLGKIVYGPNFGVELDDATLQILSRTLNGITLPFRSLSGGAMEQLSVIGRLACAITVAPEDGVPVIFDDTLGNTDPTRIEAMCALLSLAGRHCQVIVLTCVPDRFRNIGGANVVQLS